MEKIKVVDWIDYKEAEEKQDSCGGLGGWFNGSLIHGDKYGAGHRWKDYIERTPEHEVKYVEAIREAVLEQGLRISGSMQQDTHIPLFSDGTIGTFSFRGWGDLMAAIFSEKEDKDYSYMDFYYIYWKGDTLGR